MSARAYVVIVFFWAVLTFITPVLVRLSASAKHHLEYHDTKSNSSRSWDKKERSLIQENGAMVEQYKRHGGMEAGQLPRKVRVTSAPSPMPTPALAPKTGMERVVFPVRRFLRESFEAIIQQEKTFIV